MMQYDNNDTDKKLRQLENQSLPDLSKMDEHWEQLKAGLGPAMQSEDAVSLLRKPRFYLLAAAIVSIVAVVLFILPVTKKTPPVVIINTPPVDTPHVSINPEIKVTTPAAIEIKKNTIKIKHVPLPIIIPARDTVQPVLPPPPAKDYAAELDAFYKQIEKPSQQFVINPLQDTIIHGKDGSLLLIPANTFSTGPVTIVLKEYYTFQDIITNRLSTASNGLPLITGGMIHITAMVDGKEVNMKPDKAIRWFIPDTSARMKQMQLFTGVQKTQQPPAMSGQAQYEAYTATGSGPQDTVTGIRKYVNYNEVDWIPQQQLFSNNYFMTKVKVLDLRDIPVRIRSTKNGNVAIFRLSDNPRMSKADIEKTLKAKYPHYYKIKVREKAALTKAKKSQGDMTILADGVGDSIWITMRDAQRYRLTATDTITAIARQIDYEFGPRSRPINTLTTYSMYQIASRYSVDIRTLGWINCDRFYQDGRPKIPFIIDLADTASNYYTMLIFDEVKSMMTGAVSGNKVLFNDIPEGIKAKIICVGIQDGKTVAASDNVQVSRQPFKDLKFEETTPDAFKKEAGVLDK